MYMYTWKQYHLRTLKICIFIFNGFFSPDRVITVNHAVFTSCYTTSEEPKDVGLVPVPNELLVMQKACHCNKSVLPTLRVPGKCGGVVLSKCSGLF